MCLPDILRTLLRLLADIQITRTTESPADESRWIMPFFPSRVAPLSRRRVFRVTRSRHCSETRVDVPVTQLAPINVPCGIVRAVNRARSSACQRRRFQLYLCTTRGGGGGFDDTGRQTRCILRALRRIVPYKNVITGCRKRCWGAKKLIWS